MDILKKLKLEIDGIKGSISSYTSDSYIINILEKLNESISNEEISQIRYTLNKLAQWYSENQTYIQSNEFVTNKRIHINIEKDIDVYLKEIDDYKEESYIKTNRSEKMELDKKKVFIVHGHDTQAIAEVARFVEKLKLKAIILQEQASLGNTIIEKIEEYSNVGFGIVIYTPCDVGNSVDNRNNLNLRARQNVVFEHGYLMGKIGRKNVCALVKGNIELQNDISGLVYIKMDDNGAWRTQLLKEMKKQGYEIDANDLFN